MKPLFVVIPFVVVPGLPVAAHSQLSQNMLSTENSHVLYQHKLDYGKLFFNYIKVY